MFYWVLVKEGLFSECESNLVFEVVVLINIVYL